MVQLSDKKRIDKIVCLLRKAVKNLSEPSVTLVGKKWNDPFLVLVSCILSLRTKDETTLLASQRLFELAMNPKAMLTLSVLQIEKAIYPVGFYKTKARNIKGMCKDILEKFGGRVPDEIEDLLTLKGVGRKTANLVLTEGYGKLGICVDTHVHRISNRLGYIKTKNPEQTEMALRKKLPKKFWIEYNALLVTWGQNVCRPISPRCTECAISELCSKKSVTTKR
ncbi:MAG: endonuclease III [Candidatus Omnitrophica bacterium]|nr:endonuclease III [Candidatus Omnitrophota bacterium]